MSNLIKKFQMIYINIGGACYLYVVYFTLGLCYLKLKVPSGNKSYLT